METVTLLNIPNYYCSYFLLGLSQASKLRFAPQNVFAHLNGKPFLVFEYRGKVVVIENDDPIGVDEKSYGLCDTYFATNKLIGHEEYSQEKVNPLFPHYPVNNWMNYLNLFGIKGANGLGIKEFVRQNYILYRRPKYINHPFQLKTENYIFFSGSTWKKEAWANETRKAYIEACQNHPLVHFEGGMVRRQDGDPCNMPESVFTDKFSPFVFSEKSKKSIIGFNNPAVMDAVSWRLAEYLNYSCFVIAFDFKIELPILPQHGKEMHFIQDPAEFPDLIEYAVSNTTYREQVSRGGKEYFSQYCLPNVQAKRILKIATGS